ncbi:hypothetical protein ED208_04095 [Stagnimonas aquatica]|uniref:Uncharacterized protein n=2 Tax=Stagnimonas aquatica TaxID=2689987 RepID=A0A3N0VLR7_9GAMM|nr:hypothetical protein ED208_04095 [Stagnimonas aquatica]
MQTMSAPKKTNPAAAALKAALANKKAAGPGGKLVLRADKGEGARAQKDAERLAGKSRKVH